MHIKTISKEKEELGEDLKHCRERNQKLEGENRELLEKVEVE